MNIKITGISLLTGGFIDDEQGGFRAGKGCVDQIFTLKHIDEKAQAKKCRVYMGFIDLENAYDRLIGKLCGRC